MFTAVNILIIYFGGIYYDIRHANKLVYKCLNFPKN